MTTSKMVTSPNYDELREILLKKHSEYSSETEIILETLQANPTPDPNDCGSNQELIRKQEYRLETIAIRISTVENALFRIKTKTFGICMDCEGTISLKRLKAMPEANVCINCAEILTK